MLSKLSKLLGLVGAHHHRLPGASPPLWRPRGAQGCVRVSRLLGAIAARTGFGGAAPAALQEEPEIAALFEEEINECSPPATGGEGWLRP